MSEWISNVNAPGRGPQFTSYIKAYSSGKSPVSQPSNDCPGGVCVQNSVEWGASRIGSTYYPQPPTQPDSTRPNRWTITFANPYSATPVPSYFSNTSNLLCFHHDFGNAFRVQDTSSSTGLAGGSDIVFNDVTWVNVARGVFLGTTFVQINNSSIMRDTTTYPGNHLACFGSQNGGPQFSQPTDTYTWGNQINNFTAQATADDSIAMYNDVGGTPYGSTTYSLSTVSNSTITNTDQHPIRLSNNQTITGIADNTNTNLLDTGNCPFSTANTGSPVCVDSTTQSIILSTVANCDTFWLDYSAGQGCPLYFDYYTFTNQQ
jgi:hypothetical protein